MPSAATLFHGPGFEARPLAPTQVPLLQALFDANPGYFLAINGRPAGPAEAQAEFDDLPPPHLPFRQRWVVGLVGPVQQLQGVVVLVADLGTPGVWHLALLLIDQAHHGSGLAGAVMAALQAWATAGGAHWLRLGVVAGNQRAERFWQAQGFAETRQHHGVHTGGRLNTVRVLVKPLAGGTLAAYRHLVPRDCPESQLP